ncbi:hypothetical protein B7R21_12365 [Subtercola boreus]|uniref:alpha-amylase n=1 Tax=Subtercola boreus TaxID=120213 RepID=A0A3E0VNN8_9MICO|nr:carboxypeptidase regulatory-like domain-containing protein [Subtercola boreus]RFA11496.1 hypothetical protein B7R21_12365 [Subtercola boreus]
MIRRVASRFIQSRRGVALLALVLMVSGGGMAQPARAAAAPGTGTVTGTVFGGTPQGPKLAGVKVTITQDLDPDDPSYRFSTTSDSTGRFTFTDIPVPPHALVVTAEPSLDGAYRSYTTSPALLAAGATVKTDLLLPPEARITGTARTAAGVPVANVVITASRLQQEDEDEIDYPSVTSDATGTFVIRGLDKGAYRITAKTLDGLYEGPVGRFTARLDFGETAAGFEVRMFRVWQVSGKVTSAASPSVGLPGIHVSANRASSVVTDSQGNYRLRSDTPQTALRVDFDDPEDKYQSFTSGPFDVGEGSSIILNAQLSVGATVSGTLTDPTSGQPADATVSLCSSVSCGANISTDADGKYTFRALPPGTYVASFHTRFQTVWYGGKTSYDARQIVVAAGKNVTGIDAFISSEMATVSGTITRSSGNTLVPVAATVALYSPRGVAVRRTNTDASGGYTFSSIAAGEYLVHAAPDDPNLATLWYGNIADRESATTVEVERPGRLDAIDIRLTTKSSFSGGSRPAILGSNLVGSTLSVQPIAWSPQPSRVSYSWFRDGVLIPNQQLPTYTLASADAGTRLTVTVTASKVNYLSVTGTSLATSTVLRVFDRTGSPYLTGSSTVGEAVSVVTGTWVPAPAFGYQWLHNGIAIPNATKASYVPVDTDAGKRLSVIVTGATDGYLTVQKTSGQSNPVLRPFRSLERPIITGRTAVGSALSASAGSWIPEPTTVAYVWQRDGAAIPGATKVQYILAAADAGKAITVVVAAQQPGYRTITATSAATSTVLGILTSAPIPQIMGAAKVGSTMFAVTPGWQPAPVGLTFQWIRNGVAIPGATGTYYKPVAQDLGARITLNVSGTKSGYVRASRTSLPTRPVTL